MTKSKKPIPKKRLYTYRSLSVLFSIVLVFVCLEIYLWIIGWPIPGFYKEGDSRPSPLQVPSAKGGSWKNYPNQKGRLRHWDFDVEIHINTDGFRERELTDKKTNEWRVGLIGDSYGAGYGVKQSERFGEIWLKNTEKVTGSFSNLSLWNLCAPGAGTGQNVAFLKANGVKYGLDEIILAFYSGNDLQNNTSWSLLKENSQQLEEKNKKLRGKWRYLVRSHSRAAGFLWIHFLRGAETQRRFGSRFHLKEHWPNTEKYLEELLEISPGRNLTIWYIPEPFEWDDALWETLKEKFALQNKQRFLVKNLVKEWAKEHDVSFLDTGVCLKGKSSKELHFPVDGHWNSKAHKTVGQWLATQKESSYYQARKKN